MNQRVLTAAGNGEIPVGSKHDAKRWKIGGGGGCQSGNGCLGSENGVVVHGDDEGTDVFTSHILDPTGGGVGNDAGDISALADMTFRHFEAESGCSQTMGGESIQLVERIVRDSQIER